MKERKTRNGKNQHLRQVSNGLAGRLRTHESAPVEAEVEKERGDHGTGRPDQHIEKARDPSQNQKPPIGIRGSGPSSEVEPARPPGHAEDEESNQGFERLGGDGLGKAKAQQAGGQCENRVTADDVPMQVFALNPSPGPVGGQLDDSMDGNHDQGI